MSGGRRVGMDCVGELVLVNPLAGLVDLVASVGLAVRLHQTEDFQEAANTR